MKKFLLQLLLCGTCYGAATQDLVWVTNATRVQGTGPLLLLNSSNQINATTGRFLRVELNNTNLMDLIPTPAALSYLTNVAVYASGTVYAVGGEVDVLQVQLPAVSNQAQAAYDTGLVVSGVVDVLQVQVPALSNLINVVAGSAAHQPSNNVFTVSNTFSAVTHHTADIDMHSASITGVNTGAFLYATVTANATGGTEVVNYQTLTSGLCGAYISVSLTNTITSSGVRSTNVLMYTDVDLSRRISLVGSNQLQISQAGVYRIFPSIIASASSPNSHCRVWIQQNGTNVPRSAMRILLSSASQEMMLAEEVLLSCYSNDLLSVCWGSLDNAGMQLVTTGETMGPISPAAIVVLECISPQ